MSHKIVFCDCKETYVGEFFKKRYRNDPKGRIVKKLDLWLVMTETSHRKVDDSSKLLDSDTNV